MAKTLEQYIGECKPIAEAKGYEIIGIVEPFKGVHTKMINFCPNHGEWRTSTFANFKRGKSGCPGCKNEKARQDNSKNLDYYLSECKPIAEAKGIEILGINGEFIGVHTKMINLCPEHGEWRTLTFHNLKGGSGCPKCGNKRSRNSKILPDDQHIQDFINTGKFKEGTIFTKTDKKRGRDSLWCVECPACSHDEYVQAGVCDGKFYVAGNDLKQGKIPCRCATNCHYTEAQITYRVKKAVERKGYIWVGWIGKPSVRLGKFKYGCKKHGVQIGRASGLLNHGTGCPQCANQTQQQCYINHIHDEQGILCALKFGIANNSDRRIKKQNSHNVFTMKQVQVWHFSTVKQCKDAEKRCKRVLHTEAVSKYAMPDGYTETVELSCMASIQNIYKLYGGTLQEETC